MVSLKKEFTKMWCKQHDVYIRQKSINASSALYGVIHEKEYKKYGVQ